MPAATRKSESPSESTAPLSRAPAAAGVGVC
jgi:hypothetical protein